MTPMKPSERLIDARDHFLDFSPMGPKKIGSSMFQVVRH